MTQKPILNTNLTNLVPSQVSKHVMTAARSSIWRFAWQIRGGDEIYVGDSLSKKLIAKGYVDCEPGIRAYRYNATNAVHPPNRPRERWRHEIPVIWDKDFHPVHYRDGAPRYVVTPIETAWKDFRKSAENDGRFEDEDNQPFLNEGPHQRETKASKKNILGLHKSLSNRFRTWLQTEFGIKKVLQEHEYKDVKFDFFGKPSIAELKICYGGNTRFAIRAALGQLFEYNHYQLGPVFKVWWLVLDSEPSRKDFSYIAILRERYPIPLFLAWPEGRRFKTFPSELMPN